MKKPRIVLVTVVITLVVVSAAAIFVRMKLSAGKMGTIVRIARPVRGSLVEYVSAPGEIEPRIKVEISAKISARIVELPYDEGDSVTAGDPNADPAVPPSVLLQAGDAAVARGADHRPFALADDRRKGFVDVALAVEDVNQPGAGGGVEVVGQGLARGGDAALPFVAFFFFGGAFFAVLGFAALGGIATPGRQVQQPQRQAVLAQGQHRVQQHRRQVEVAARAPVT